METINIKKAKLNSKGGADVTYIDGGGNERVLKGTFQADESLISAFRRLSPYFTDLTEQKEAEHINWSDPDDMPLIVTQVTAVQRVMTDGSEKVTLSGTRTLKNGNVIPVVSAVLDMETLGYEWSHSKAFDIEWHNLLLALENYVLSANETH